MPVTKITACRICGRGDFISVIDLGIQYVSTFVKPDQPRDELTKAPLNMVRCANCSLVQLMNTVDPDILYRQFWYESGINESMQRALAEIIDIACIYVPVKAGDLVIDIGCNDGTMLQQYKSEIRTVGFEPALNLAKQCEGIELISDYFSYRDLGQQAKHIHSIAMFYDLQDPNSFITDVAKMMAPDGIWVNQLSHLAIMIQDCAFDTICHEHLEYYSLTVLMALYKKHGLEIIDVTENSVNGGSYRVIAQHKGGPTRSLAGSYRIEQILDKEQQLLTSESYKRFSDGIRNRRAELVQILFKEQADGRVTHVYGASTKGNTLLQTYGIDNTMIPIAADRNPAKWGLQTVGSWIPIFSEKDSRIMQPDNYLVLPWAFASAFIQREAEFLERGGTLILPLPEVEQVRR